MSKCGRNKKDVLTTFWCTDAWQHGIYYFVKDWVHRNMESQLCCIKYKETSHTKFWLFLIIENKLSGSFPSFDKLDHENRHLTYLHLLSIQNEGNSLVALQINTFWLVQRNHAAVFIYASVLAREPIKRLQNWVYFIKCHRLVLQYYVVSCRMTQKRKLMKMHEIHTLTAFINILLK